MFALRAAIFALAFGSAATSWLTRRYPERFKKPNYVGKMIPAMAGLAFVLAADIFYGYQALQQTPYYQKLPLIYLLVAVGFGALGLLDDLGGDRTTGGFRGHFRRLFKERKLTTGAIKAIFGGVFALIAGWLLTGPSVISTILAALLIALTANALNLIDLRPGRCLAGFLLAAILIVVVLKVNHMLPTAGLFYFALSAAILMYPFDARGKIMLGDTGANSLGAVLGLSMALFFSMEWQGVIVALLVAFHIWAEKRSLTKLIEETPLLSRIDRKIGIR
jgi:UDP-N-acetylmuramyl pentapeptide phosphotransferase/UDP-N-acetylglucosamine-1-phosphate transferase